MIDLLSALLYPLRDFGSHVADGDLSGIYALAVYVLAIGVLGFGITLIRRLTNV